MKRERDSNRLADYFHARVDTEGTWELDERTWVDLGMDDVFAQVDGTLSVPGEQALYATLRRPGVSDEALARRRELVERVGQAGAGDVRRALDRLGTKDGDHLADRLWGKWGAPPFPRWLYQLAALAVVALPVGLGLTLGVRFGAAVLVPLYLLNVKLHTQTRLLGEGDMVSGRYVARLLRAAAELGRLALPRLAAELGTLAAIARRGRTLRRKLLAVMALSAPTVDDLVGIFNVFFLIEARAYAASHGEIQRLLPELREAFRIVGALDVAQSIARCRTDRAGWCQPHFTDAHRLDIDALVHPLLEQGVANSIALGPGGLVVTGSNMSGKSTFLRSIGLAAVLAQTVLTVPARAYAACPWRVMTVMKSDDDLGRGKSLYLDEAASVLRVVQAAAALPPVLCLLDEPYRGTNSTERVAGAVAVMRFLVASGACAVLATHDTETVTLLGDAVENGHFEDRVAPRGLEFDYRFVAGPAVRTNAIDLLEHLGYPASLVAVARDCAAALQARRG